jgi:hypothetical protein
VDEADLTWTDVIDPSTGWLRPGRHFAEFDELRAEFVERIGGETRERIGAALHALLRVLKELIPSGSLFIAGGFVSRQPGDPEAPTNGIAPHDASAIESWTDAEEDRFMLHQSLHDVTVGAMGHAYVPVLHPLGGYLEVYYIGDGESIIVELTAMMGAVVMSSGETTVGVRGVVELEW